MNLITAIVCLLALASIVSTVALVAATKLSGRIYKLHSTLAGFDESDEL